MPSARNRGTIAVVVAALVAPEAAHAYLDPGTGSVILQAVIGSVAVGLLVLKRQWARIRAFLSRRPASTSESDEKDGA